MGVLLALTLAAHGASDGWTDPSLSADVADLIEFDRLDDARAFG